MCTIVHASSGSLFGASALKISKLRRFCGIGEILDLLESSRLILLTIATRLRFAGIGAHRHQFIGVSWCHPFGSAIVHFHNLISFLVLSVFDFCLIAVPAWAIDPAPPWRIRGRFLACPQLWTLFRSVGSPLTHYRSCNTAHGSRRAGSPPM